MMFANNLQQYGFSQDDESLIRQQQRQRLFQALLANATQLHTGGFGRDMAAAMDPTDLAQQLYAQRRRESLDNENRAYRQSLEERREAQSRIAEENLRLKKIKAIQEEFERRQEAAKAQRDLESSAAAGVEKAKQGAWTRIMFDQALEGKSPEEQEALRLRWRVDRDGAVKAASRYEGEDDPRRITYQVGAGLYDQVDPDRGVVIKRFGDGKPKAESGSESGDVATKAQIMSRAQKLSSSDVDLATGKPRMPFEYYMQQAASEYSRAGELQSGSSRWVDQARESEPADISLSSDEVEARKRIQDAGISRKEAEAMLLQKGLSSAVILRILDGIE